MKKSNQTIQKITGSAVLMALGMILPFFTGLVPSFGKMLLPMHIPVFLCSFLCGWQYGLIVGFLLPLFHSALFGVPILYPVALSMAFELATYGCTADLLYRSFHKKGTLPLCGALVLSMLCGRVVLGISEAILFGIGNHPFSFPLFITSAFVNAIPGILLQLLLIPSLMVALRPTEFSRSHRKKGEKA